MNSISKNCPSRMCSNRDLPSDGKLVVPGDILHHLTYGACTVTHVHCWDGHCVDFKTEEGKLVERVYSLLDFRRYPKLKLMGKKA